MIPPCFTVEMVMPFVAIFPYRVLSFLVVLKTEVSKGTTHNVQVKAISVKILEAQYKEQ